MKATITTEAHSTALQHEAMLYRDNREYLFGVLPYVREALAAERPVLVEVPGPRLELVREALGRDGARVQLGDMTVEGRNPGRIIPGILGPFVDAHPRRRATMIGEPIWPGRTADEYAAAVQHEALVNLAFAEQQASVLCPYNVAELPEYATVDAERTHPVIVQHGERKASPRYTDPQAVVETAYDSLPGPPADAETYELDAAAYARQLVAVRAEQVGLPAHRVADLEIAISEVVGNSIVHAGNGATLHMWVADNSLVCEVRDPGRIDNPLAGRLPPPSSQESGRGLLMVNHLCDLVQIRTGDAGSAVWLWMDLPTTL